MGSNEVSGAAPMKGLQKVLVESQFSRKHTITPLPKKSELGRAEGIT
jgi:hypothetical protein